MDIGSKIERINNKRIYNIYMTYIVCERYSYTQIWIYVYLSLYTLYIRYANTSHVTYIPQTEEIRLKIITTAKFFDKFSRQSPFISNTFSRESPNFHTRFHVCKRSSRHSKDLTRKFSISRSSFFKSDLLRGWLVRTDAWTMLRA